MTSTRSDLQSNDISIAKAPRKRQTSRLNSTGIKLFVSVMIGAIAGLGVTGYFFYRTLEKEAKIQIQSSLKTEVQAIDSELGQGEQFLLGMVNAAQILHANKTSSADDYKRLVLSLMSIRPKLVTGFGILQTPKGLVADRPWFGPYVVEYKAQAVEQVKQGIAERLAPPHEGFAYQETTITDEYFKQDYYKDPFKLAKNYWVEPYTTEVYSVPLTTFAGPIKDAQGKLIAVFNGDIALQDLVAAFKDKSAYQDAGYYVLLTGEGNILAYPPDPKKATGSESTKVIPELSKIWPDIQRDLPKAPTGILQSDNTSSYWAYQRVPRTGWIMLAKVPYGAVTGPAIQIVIGGALLAAAILAGVVILFSRQLNRRLQPILEECDKLAATDAETEARRQDQDEIGQLSVSFFNLLDQLTVKEAKIRQESEGRLRLAAQAQEENEVLQADVGHILDVVSAVEVGDLTVQAEVSDRATGLVADTLNRLIEELARIMSAVVGTAKQVTYSADDLERLAAMVAQQAQQQSQSVADVQQLVNNVTGLSQNTAQQAVIANTAVQEAQVAVSQGQAGVGLMTHGITDLQQGADQIVKRVQTLADFVNLASQFAKDQKRVAALTRVLALNASMIAARASGQQDPEQFASVAKEFATIAGQVNDLAVQTNQGLLLLQQRTDQIQTAVSGISQDAEGIDTLVSQFTTSVKQSKQAFDAIKAATEQVAQVGEQVTQSSQAIAAAAQTTLASVEDIAAVAVATEGQSRFTREQVASMGRLAQSLLDRVEFFRLATVPEAASQTLPAAASSDQEVDAHANGLSVLR